MTENTFWEHAAELRLVLVKAIVVIAFGTGCALFFYQDLFSMLTFPLKQIQQESTTAPSLQYQEIKRIRISNTGVEDSFYTVAPAIDRIASFSSGVQKIEPNLFLIPAGGYLDLDRTHPQQEELVILGPIEGMLASIKISFLAGIVGTSPLWLFFLLQFLTPALYANEKRLVLPFLALSFVFLAAGFFFAFFVTIPFANKYLKLFNDGIGINLWTLSHYIDYTAALLLSGALAFELAVILFFLVHFGLITAEALRRKRRLAIVAAFIIGAVLTPPDVLTQLMLAIPLIVLYEVSILYAVYKNLPH